MAFFIGRSFYFPLAKNLLALVLEFMRTAKGLRERKNKSGPIFTSKDLSNLTGHPKGKVEAKDAVLVAGHESDQGR